jgi:hypothetical protein
MNRAAIIVVITCIIVMVVMVSLAAFSHQDRWGSWDGGGYEDGDDDGWNSFSGKLEYDVTDDKARLMIAHDGGPRIIWAEYKIIVNGTEFTTHITTAEVGTDTPFYQEPTQIYLDGEFEVKIIKMEDQRIVWERILVAIAGEW